MSSPDVEKATPRRNASPGPSSRPLATLPQQARPFQLSTPGDPSGLGLFSFASTLLIWSLYNLGTRRITHPNFIIGMAIFCGGLSMILAGMWAFPRRDAFVGTMFVMYGAFWLSYASILLPGTGILASYVFESEFRSALGIYFIVWGLVSFALGIISLQRNWAYPSVLFLLMITFWILSAGSFLGSIVTIKVAGVFGCITSCVAFIGGLSLLWGAEQDFEADDKPVYWLPLGPAIL